MTKGIDHIAFEKIAMHFGRWGLPRGIIYLLKQFHFCFSRRNFFCHNPHAIFYFVRLLLGLSEKRSEAERRGIVDDFFKTYEQKIVGNPDDHALDYVHAFIVIEKQF